jgi:hypothetical protein
MQSVHRSAPTIHRGSPGIDAAIERLIAFAQLLPFKPAEAALGLDRHQLLADELLDPLGVGAA